jgi:hypothetical protein
MKNTPISGSEKATKYLFSDNISVRNRGLGRIDVVNPRLLDFHECQVMLKQMDKYVNSPGKLLSFYKGRKSTAASCNYQPKPTLDHDRIASYLFELNVVLNGLQH